MKILVVIPAYNEEANIERVVKNLIDNYPQYDYVVVNDGSKDQTAEICKKNHFNLLDQPINLGLAGAFQTGMKYAYEMGYDAAIQFDGDGQHRPEYIEKMVNEIQNGMDIVIGSRFVSEQKPSSLRMLGSNIIESMINTGNTIKDPTSGMRMYNKKILKLLAENLNMGPEPDTISYLMKSGAKVKEIQVHMDERIAGESYLTLSRSIKYMLTMSVLLISFFRKKTEME